MYQLRTTTTNSQCTHTRPQTMVSVKIPKSSVTGRKIFITMVNFPMFLFSY